MRETVNMSTQPQLSPIEQLMMQGSQPKSSTQPQDQSNLSPLEQLAAMGAQQQESQAPSQQSELSPLEQLGAMKPQEPATPGADIQPVITSTNPKLAAAEAGKDMPEYVGATGALAAGAMGLSAAEPVLSALAPHLPSLQKARDILLALGGGAYTLEHLGKVLHIINGSKK